ncbi:hypothetical protein MUA04_09355 [Enterobacteriaceae bacterium H11S18]|uniref:hypothetical protein n=1 Tax=Enterobacteriaceae TaxID=543 RepID=UPI0019262C08|nr:MULTISPECIES: hypothetical protein [Enterobacteriaceae]MCT4710396.1 hypothetical protein [Dryocola clanedunensis]
MESVLSYPQVIIRGDFSIIGGKKGDKWAKLRPAMRAITQKQQLFYFIGKFITFSCLETRDWLLRILLMVLM